MASWAECEAAAPGVAEAGERLLYQSGLGFLATVRQYVGPRLHPVCPVIAADGLYVFAVPSPKRGDLWPPPYTKWAAPEVGPDREIEK